MSDLTPIAKLAIDKAVGSKSKKAARDEVKVGEYWIDEMVRVVGTLRVGEDTTKVATCSILNEEFLILALKMAGCTRDRAVEVIRNLASECAGALGKVAKEARQEMLEEYDPDGEIKGIFTELKESLPRTKVRGKVTFDGVVEAVEAVEAVKTVKKARTKKKLKGVA